MLFKVSDKMNMRLERMHKEVDLSIKQRHYKKNSAKMQRYQPEGLSGILLTPAGKRMKGHGCVTFQFEDELFLE